MVDEQQPDESSSELDRILLEYFRRIDAGEEVNKDEFLAAHPEHAEALAEFLSAEQQFQPEPADSTHQNTPTILSDSLKASAGESLQVLRYFGDYELLEEIARGGMGVVYKARQTSLNRIVAVKMILAGQLARESDVQRFRVEAEAVAKLQHPHIVQIYEVGEQDGQYYFSMEYIQGGSFSDLIQDKSCEPRQAAKLVKSVAEAVYFAHMRNIVHRDLKPGNILIDTEGNPKVSDFGLAKNVESDSGLTVTGAIVGTPSFMAPEQAAGDREDVGPLADVYALGGLLYFLLTERPPFSGKTPVETIRKVTDAEPELPRKYNSDVDRNLTTICLKCLNKDMGRRYASAKELADDLSRWLDRRPILARRTPVWEKAWLWCRRRPAVASLLLSLILIVSVAGIFVRQREQRLVAEALVDRIVSSKTTEIPQVIDQISELRRWADSMLRTRLDESEDGSEAKLHLSLALLPADQTQLDYLSKRLLTCSVNQLAVLRDELKPYREQLQKSLWKSALDPKQSTETRFRVAAVLADYSSSDKRWKQLVPFVAEYLTESIPAVSLDQWRGLYRPARTKLAESLVTIHADRHRSAAQRAAAAFVLADYLRAEPNRLVKSILLADEPAEFSVLLESLQAHAVSVKDSLLTVLHTEMPEPLDKTNSQLNRADEQLRDPYWKRKSLAAVTLVHLGYSDEIWPLLKFSANPSLRSFIIHHLGKLETDPQLLASRLGVEENVSVRRALIQCLGGLDPTGIPAQDRQRMVEELVDLYVKDPDAGVHGSASWTLRQWGVELPDLSVNQPELSPEQSRRVNELKAQLETLQQEVEAAEANLPKRQADWEKKLSQQTLHSASLQKGLVAHFPLDETSGSSASNAVARETPAFYEGPGEPEWGPGVVGNAVRLNGIGGRFNCGEIFNPERSDPFAYGGWFLSTSAQQNALLIASVDIDNHFLGQLLRLRQKGFSGSLIHRGVFSSNPNNLIQFAPVNEMHNQWHHLFMSYDGSTDAEGLTLYLDGVPVASEIYGNSLSQSIRNEISLFIGGMSDEHFSFEGMVDDIRIYDRVLREREVRNMFLHGIQSLASITTEDRTTEQQQLLTKTFRALDSKQLHLEERTESLLAEYRRARRRAAGSWFVNHQGQTMVVFEMPYKSDHENIEMHVAISSAEVTNRQYHRSLDWHNASEKIRPVTAQGGISWYAAAAYCNWLSEREGLPEEQWVYEPNSNGLYAEGMLVKENFLQLSGYRLPTEEEWEYACSAGSEGTYCFGEPVELLENYAVYFSSSTGEVQAVMSRKPNELGLFDMHGHLWEWTNSLSESGTQKVRNELDHILRGGSFVHMPYATTSKTNHKTTPANNFAYNGFRVARTMIEEPLAFEGDNGTVVVDSEGGAMPVPEQETQFPAKPSAASNATEFAKPDEERKIAKWIIDNGGRVNVGLMEENLPLAIRRSVFAGRENHEIRRVDDLPSKAFTIIRVVFSNSAVKLSPLYERLYRLPNLKNCRLENLRITDGDLPDVEKMRSLTALGLQLNREITDASIPAFKKWRQLSVLYLYHTGLSRRGVQELQKALKGSSVKVISQFESE